MSQGTSSSSAAANSPRAVAVISLGGTIASDSSDPGVSGGQGVVPRLSAEDLIRGITGAECDAKILPRSFRQLPSASLRVRDILALSAEISLAFASGVDGVVVTQGTDTLEETAYILDLLHAGSQPVVVTGAMRHPGAPGADGPANLLGAIRVAAAMESPGLGVLVVLHDEIHAARWAAKRHTSSTSAFTSSGMGPLGWIAEGRVNIAFRPATRSSLAAPDPEELTPVASLCVGMDEDGRLLEKLPELGYGGAVLQGMGGGHVPSVMVEAVAALTEKIPVVLASKTGAGEMLQQTYGFQGSEIDLLSRGVISAGALSPSKARLLLMLLIAGGLSRGQELRSAFLQHAGGSPLGQVP